MDTMPDSCTVDELAAKNRLPRILTLLEAQVGMNAIINLQEVSFVPIGVCSSSY